MGESRYLTIEETAKKLGRPASWVKDRICEGKLGATLAGRQWLISPQDIDELMLNNPSPRDPEKIVHNFLSDRPIRKPHSARNAQKASKPSRRSEASERSRKSSPSAKSVRPRKDRDRRPTLTQKIKELDREFDQQSTLLRTATLEYRAAIRLGKKVEPPNELLHQWRMMKAELKYLIAKANTKGLLLPTNLSIYKVLAREAGSVEQKSVARSDVTLTKPPMKIKGIDGYYVRADRDDSPKAQKIPADVEARLIILRNRERAAAHSMQDRGKSRAAREAAAHAWAQARREAEKLERELQAARRPT